VIPGWTVSISVTASTLGCAAACDVVPVTVSLEHDSGTHTSGDISSSAVVQSALAVVSFSGTPADLTLQTDARQHLTLTAQSVHNNAKVPQNPQFWLPLP